MAIPKTSFHARSISLPTACHPQDASIEDHFRRLRASQDCPVFSSSICQNLCSIKDLYEQINNSVHLPHNLNGLCSKEVEDVLEASVTLLDASSSAQDALSDMKEIILALESALRRGTEEDGINAYLASRKNIIKKVSKCLVNLKKEEKKCALSHPENESNIVKMVKESQVMSLSTLKSLLSFVKGSSSQTGSWSTIAKLVKSKSKSKHAPRDAEKVTEVDQVDRSLTTATKAALIKQVHTLETVIHELEDIVESVSRCFVKTRVSLLNVLNKF